MQSVKSKAPPILLVDDEQEILDLTRMTLGCEGLHNVLTLQDSRRLMSLLREQKVSAIVLDLMMPYLSGTELLQILVNEFPHIPVIIMTASDDLETAIECLKIGAFDYLLKPVEPNRLLSAIDKALKLNSLQDELSSLKECLLTGRLEHSDVFADIITGSPKMRAIFQYVEVISKSRQPILITGETGVGKELMACAIHKLTGLKGDFVTVNVAGLDDMMFSDTLFGHRKGAYTGADQSREGLIAKASGGTLFLDEIGDLSQFSQVKLLRLLQEEEYYTLGSDVLKRADARILVATNHNLLQSVEKGLFRKDLYYRLCAYQVNIPPLCERMEDVPLLLDHFIEEAARSLDKPKPVLSPEVAPHLSRHNFPGNIREFKAVVYNAVARHREGPLTLKEFPCIARHSQALPMDGELPDKKIDDDVLTAIFGRFPTLQEVEDYMVERAMQIAEGRQSVAAEMLGITRQGLHKRIKWNRKSE